MKETPLGKTIPHPLIRSPKILFPIERSLGRKEIGIGKKLPFQGFDEWNSYEFSWLDNKGKPERCFLQLKVPCDSPYLVESKSLKLYLGSYLQERFSSLSCVQQLIESDLSALLKTKVSSSLLPISSSTFALKKIQGVCLDQEEISIDCYTLCPSFLQTEPIAAEEVLYTHLFKSNCPVTGQPDHATILIGYKGNKISHKNLLRYLVSYRNHQEYHECCVERIFIDLQKYCKPDTLSVAARFSRRGGIDINPYRYSIGSTAIQSGRSVFQ